MPPRRGRAPPAARPGTSIATTWAPRTASATSFTGRPASSAAARDELSAPEADLDLDARVGEIERMRVPLAAVAENRDLSRQETDDLPS